jgi:hypothetical protein
MSSMPLTIAERKRSEANEFWRAAQTLSLHRDRDWCLEQAAILDREANEAERAGARRSAKKTAPLSGAEG